MQGSKFRKALSTITVAKMLGVAVASVSKWIDEGQIIAGRTPGGHRRVQVHNLLDFLRRHKLPIPPELQDSSRKVLILDGDITFISWLTEELRRRHPDLEILVAHDGFTAGELVATYTPEIIIINVKMPGTDGLEVCRRIKSKPSTKHISVIVISSGLFPASEDNLLKMGAQACFGKPLDVESLEALISKALAHSR